MPRTTSLALALVLATTLQPFASSASDAEVFPSALHGTWNPVPHDCNVRDDGNDLRFEISGSSRTNHEDIERLVGAIELPGIPAAWRLVTVSNVVGPEEGQSRIYVLGRKYLFVTDGDRMDQYVQCRQDDDAQRDVR